MKGVWIPVDILINKKLPLNARICLAQIRNLKGNFLYDFGMTLTGLEDAEYRHALRVLLAQGLIEFYELGGKKKLRVK